MAATCLFCCLQCSVKVGYLGVGVGGLLEQLSHRCDNST